MILDKSKKVKKSAFAFTMSDAHNNVFGFAQDGYIYTYVGDSSTEGEAWLRMQRTGERGKDRKKYFLYFADETEPSAVVDKHNNIYDMDGYYIATLSHARIFVILLVILAFIIFLSGLALYLGGEAIMQTTAPFSDKNTVSLSLDDDDTTAGGNTNKKPDKTHEQAFDIFGIDDDDDDTKEITKETTTKKNSESTTLYEKGEADLSDLNKKRVIYPGLSGEYQFMVNDTGNTSLFYKMTFSEKNNYNIPMRFKLKQGKKYVVGDENTWVTIDKLNTNPQRIEKGEEIVYTIEWKWVETDDAHDTQLGMEAIANYDFTVKVDFESAY